MITPITATFPALNFPKEVDYPTQEDWAAFSAAAELNYGILSGEWSDKSEEFKAQANNLALEIQDIGENAINAITFDNIAQLKLNSNIGRVDVLGYYTKGDGGGGTFYWDSTSTEADNGGTIIQATGIITGRWKRVFSGAVNVKWFGAKGDGVFSSIWSGTDNKIPLQNAIKYLYSKVATVETDWFKNSSPLKLIIPDGKYYISDSVLFRGKLKIIGNGCIIGTNSSNPVFDSAWQSGGEWVSSWSLVDTIEDPTNGINITYFAHADMQFENISFYDCDIAIRSNGSLFGSYTKGLKFTQCGQGIVEKNCFYSKHYQPTFIRTKNSSFDTKGKIEFGFASNSIDIEKPIFSNIQSTLGHDQGIGIHFKNGAKNITISSPNFEVIGTGILLNGGCNSLTITNAYAEECFRIITDSGDDMQKYNLKLLTSTCNGGRLCTLGNLKASKIEETLFGGSIEITYSSNINDVEIYEWSRKTNPTKFNVSNNDYGVKFIPMTHTFGRDANGNTWIQHSNGIMECFGEFMQSITTTGAGTLHRKQYVGTSLPIIFSTTPVVEVVPVWNTSDSNTANIWIGSVAPSTTAFSGNLFSVVAISNINMQFKYRAIGRWY